MERNKRGWHLSARNRVDQTDGGRIRTYIGAMLDQYSGGVDVGEDMLYAHLMEYNHARFRAGGLFPFGVARHDPMTGATSALSGARWASVGTMQTGGIITNAGFDLGGGTLQPVYSGASMMAPKFGTPSYMPQTAGYYRPAPPLTVRGIRGIKR